MTLQNRQNIYISYLDKNNLYGCAVCRYLLYSGFKWLKNVDGSDVNLISKKSSIGYIFEVDLQSWPEYFRQTVVFL